MNEQHTPGPWKIRTSGSVGTNLMMVASVYPMESEAPEENAANANLIAAAPCLLAALQELAEDIADRFDMDSPSTNPGMKSAVAQARAAIARALPQPSAGN